MITAAIRDPENVDLLSIQEVNMDFGTGESKSVTVLAWLNQDFTHSPMVIFCTPEVTDLLQLDNPETRKQAE